MRLLKSDAVVFNSPNIHVVGQNEAEMDEEIDLSLTKERKCKRVNKNVVLAESNTIRGSDSHIVVDDVKHHGVFFSVYSISARSLDGLCWEPY